MTILISPQRIDIEANTQVVFLAGSIELGKAENWQVGLGEFIHALDPSIIVANPRRVSWDPTWVQSIDNPPFKDQVEWELDHLERANLVVFYFQPGTQSPITLLELGKHLARKDSHMSTLVCCPEGFWRRGNVEIMMDRAKLGRPLGGLGALRAHTEKWFANNPKRLA